MTGHFKNSVDQIDKVLWSDAEFESLEIDYDSVRIKIGEVNGLSKVITCHGYIGFEGVGLWDEIVIDTAVIYKEHDLIDRSLKSISNAHGEETTDSGSPARNIRKWNLLQIKFIDDSEINVVMTKVSINNK